MKWVLHALNIVNTSYAKKKKEKKMAVGINVLH